MMYLVNVYSLDGKNIYSNSYSDNNTIMSIKIDLFKIFHMIDFKIIHNITELDDNITIKKIVEYILDDNEKIINLTLIKTTGSINKSYLNVLVFILKKKIIFYDTNNNIYITFKKLNILKIIKNNHIYNRKTYGLGYILLTNNKLYMITTNNIILVNKNINNIFESNDIFFILTNTSMLLFKYINSNFEAESEYIIDISNICNLHDIKNIVSFNQYNYDINKPIVNIYIQTYDNTIYILFDIYNYDNKFISYFNVKKFLIDENTHITYIIHTYDGSIFFEDDIFLEITKDRKFIDIYTKPNKSFYCAIDDNKEIYIFGYDVKDHYKITESLKSNLIDIKQIILESGFIAAINENNIVLWGPRIKEKTGKNFIKIKKNIKYINHDWGSIVIITKNNKLLLINSNNGFGLNLYISIKESIIKNILYITKIRYNKFLLFTNKNEIYSLELLSYINNDIRHNLVLVKSNIKKCITDVFFTQIFIKNNNKIKIYNEYKKIEIKDFISYKKVISLL